jgi:thioredoxin 1
MKNVYLFILAFVLITGCKKELVDTAANDIKDLNSLESLNSEIASGVTLVFYHASWCAVCKEQRPAVESLSKNTEAAFAKFCEMEFDDNKEAVRAKKVTGFSTLVLYRNGEEKQRWNGKGHTEVDLLKALMDNQ